MKKKPLTYSPKKNKIGTKLEFCTNCDDLDEFALDDQVKEVGKLYERFHNCEDTGKFQGDLCSRLFIVTDKTSLESNTDTDEEDTLSL